MLYAALLPLNLYRLWQLHRLIADVARAAEGDLSIDWLLPYMDKKQAKAGEYLFHGGDQADGMLYIVRGDLSLPEVDVERGAGELIGEIGIFSPERQRTTSAKCKTDCDYLFISDRKVFSLYHQNQKFGIYLLRLIVGRLVREVDRK